MAKRITRTKRRRQDCGKIKALCNELYRQVNTEKCETNSVTVTNYARRFPLGRWSNLGPGSGKKRYGTYSDKTKRKWDKAAERMMLNFAESGHPIFRATSALERGELRSKGKGKKSIPFNGSEETIELILRTIIFVNQLRRRKLQRMKIWNQLKYLQDFLLLILTPTRSCKETWCEIMN